MLQVTLIAGESVSQAISLAAKSTPSDGGTPAANVRESFYNWATLNFFSAVRKPLELVGC